MRFLIQLLALAIGVSQPAMARARWLEARSTSFIVYSDGEEGDLRRSIGRLEEFDQLLRALTGTTAPPSPAPLTIYLVSSNEKLRQVQPVSSEVRGFYGARVGGMAAFAIRGDVLGMGAEEVLFHEYAHHFAMRYYPAYYPRWFNEGFAEYVMTAQLASDRVEIGRFNPGRAITLLRGTWLPVDRIFSDNMENLGFAQMGQFYAESWLIVHYLFATPARREALARYLAELHRGTPEPAAFRSTFGLDHQAFERDLRSYMEGRIAFGTIARSTDSTTPVDVRALPPSADDLLLPHAALMLGIREPSREAGVLRTIRKIAARYANDRYAQKVLARAEIGSGDRALGTAIIDRLLELSPRDPELLYLRGISDFYSAREDKQRRAEHLAAARPWFARAVAADPAYYTALYRLAQTAPDSSGKVSEETISQFTAAHDLAPLVGDIAIDAAEALNSDGRKVEAERALLPIATNPHGGNVERARRLLEKVRSNQPASSTH